MPDSFKIKMAGEDTILRTMALAGVRTPEVLAAALLDEAHIIFRISQLQVPYRYGALKGSGRVSLPVISGGNVFVDITYGGPSIAYAYIMHKGIMYGHPINYRNGKKDHYLSDPVRERAPFIEANIADRINISLRSAQ